MKYIFFLATMLFFTTQNIAQRSDRIEAFKVGIFSQQMELTVEESKIFWPMYNEYEAEKKALKNKYNIQGQFKNFDTATDEAAEELVLKHFEKEEAELTLKRTYFEKFKTILPIKKVAKIYNAERMFKQKLLQEMRRRKRG